MIQIKSYHVTGNVVPTHSGHGCNKRVGRFMGVIDKLSSIATRLNRSNVAEYPPACAHEIVAFVEGVVIPLGSVSDPAFSSGMLGPGCGILPEGDVVCAPINGVVSAIGNPNRHALCLYTDDGIEVLVHVGVNTSSLQNAFEPLVERGTFVHAGEPLLHISRQKIEEAGCDPVVIGTITKGCTPNGARLLRQGIVRVGEPLLELVGRE